MIQNLQKAINEAKQLKETMKEALKGAGGLELTREISMTNELLLTLEGAAKFITENGDGSTHLLQEQE